MLTGLQWLHSLKIPIEGYLSTAKLVVDS